jgi:hypothetical protein
MIWESSHKLIRAKVLVRTLHFTLITLILSMFFATFAHASTHAYSWTKTMGGINDDFGFSVAVDGSGNVYVTGRFEGTVDFDPGAGTDNHTSAGGYDIYLTRINSDGTYGWTKTIGGGSDDRGRSVAVDGNANIYVTGLFSGTVDFDPGAGTDNHTSAASSDMFLTRFDDEGNYGWTKTMGGTGYEVGLSVAADGSGNVYFTGTFEGTADFDPGAGTDNHTSVGDADIFLTKINSDGSYGWTKTMGGGSDGVGWAVALDGSGNVYVTGEFKGTTDFDPGAGTDNHTPEGDSDIFLTRINSDGSYGWTKTMGGTGVDIGYSVALDGNGNIYVTGSFNGTVDLDPGVATDNHTSAGGFDIFLTRINSDGSYGWAKTMGGTGADEGNSVAVDGRGNVYVTGFFHGTVDFDPGVATDNHTSAGDVDIFLTRINSDGSYGWTKAMGGVSADISYWVAVDGSGNVYVVGYFAGTADFDPGVATDNHTSVGGFDIFLTKFGFSSYHDFNGDGNTDILGLNSAGMIWWYDISGDTWHNVAGSLADMVAGDFNGDMISDIAGLNASGQIWWYDVDGAAWHSIPGTLASLVVGDFNGTGIDDIAGINSSGQIWVYSVDVEAWDKIPGTLASMVVGAFNVDDNDDLAGINSSGQIWWHDVNMEAWHSIPGTLASLVVGDFNGDGNDDLAGLNASGQIWWYDVDGEAWYSIPGSLTFLLVGDFNGDRNDDLAGINSSGQIWWYDVDGAAWHSIPGTLASLVVGDYDGDGDTDLAGLNASGQIWYTTDMNNWQNIPGSLEELY